MKETARDREVERERQRDADCHIFDGRGNDTPAERATLRVKKKKKKKHPEHSIFLQNKIGVVEIKPKIKERGERRDRFFDQSSNPRKHEKRNNNRRS